MNLIDKLKKRFDVWQEGNAELLMDKHQLNHVKQVARQILYAIRVRPDHYTYGVQVKKLKLICRYVQRVKPEVER